MFGRRARKLLVTTEKTLPRPYVELGIVFNFSNQLWYGRALRALEKRARRRFPAADAVIGVTVQSNILGMRLVGTAVRYT